MTAEEVFIFPLSFAQQRLWFLHQLDPLSAGYNMPVAFRLSGPLDVEALQWALNEIVRRHEILRTTFDVLDQQPVQVIASTGNLTLTITDLSSLPVPESELEAARLANEETQRPFDLVRGPLVRAVLLRLWTNEHVLLLTMHHIVSDGWSQAVLMSELGVLYEAGVADRRSPLPDLSIQYADFAEWQREWLRGEVLDQQMEYWRTNLAGVPASFELPADRPRPPIQSFNGARESFMLPADLSSRLVELSRREDVTLFMTLLAAFVVLLHRYTGETDIVVGTPVANRNRSELETLIGFFVNTLALRIDLAGDPSFRRFLARVREVALGAYAHQDLPFDMLVEELRPVRDPSRNPLFQVMFALQNTPEAASQRSELVISPVAVKTTRALFDLTLDMTESGGQLHGSLVYNTDLFDASTIRLMAEHFRVLLAGVVAGAERPISALPLLTTADSRRLLVDWNDTARDSGGEVFVQRLFEQQVERAPEAIALVFEEDRVSYGELNERANKLAHYLIASGVAPESLVGLMLERSAEMIVALLAILKAGGAYVPLDPEYPPARLSYVLADARISMVVSDHRSSTRLPPLHGVRIICVDREANEISQHSDWNPACRTSSDNAAYVIYTSGSTGAPKGVVTAHRGIGNLVAALVQAFAIHQESCVLQFASLGFDAAVQEIFTALTTGARLCLMRRETLLSGRRFAELAQKQNVTVATFPPSMLAVLSPKEWPTLETVVSAGERCPAEIAARWSQGRRFINGYGPTEATVGAILYQYDGAHTGEPPIGRPLSNTQIYLLDQHLNLIPIGAVGELYLGGVGLARGYLHRPGLTAARFIPNPFSPAPGARLYKTGDMARYLPDGNIRFLGRRDEQLKIRGFRIEPGEIESTLKEHADVLDAAVVAGEDRRGDQCLVAYVTLRRLISSEELLSLARQRLPDYMVPSVLTILDELPLLANGKLDRGALRVKEKAQVARVGQRIGPRNLLESQLAGIWEELLHVEPDVRDNFFELGGHSLLIVSLLARVEQVTGKRLDLAAVFRAPTIESLALLLRGVDLSSSLPLVAIQPHGSLTPVFFVHPAGGSVSGYFALARALGSERPFYALQRTSNDCESATAGSFTDEVRGRAQDGSAGRQIESIAAKYVDAVRTVLPEGPYLLGGWSTGGVMAFEMARQLQARRAEVALVALLDSAAPGHKDRDVTSNAALLTAFAINLGVPKNLLFAAPDEVLRSGKQTQLNWVLDQARRSQVLPPDVSVEDLRHWLDLYVADIEAVENYRPPVSPVPLLLLLAAEEGDGEVANPGTDRGWTRLSNNQFEVQSVPGDHFTMMRSPHVYTLAEVLRKHFTQARKTSAA